VLFVGTATNTAGVPGLRNEDYVAFLDESGEDGLQVVSGVLIPARWLRSAERRWRDFVRDRLGSRSGRLEIKGRDLLSGRGASLHAQQALLEKGWPSLSARAAGRLLYRDALEHIATIAEVRVLSVGLPTDRPIEVYRLWYWLMYTLLVERAQAPRPRLPICVIDGQDASLRDTQDLIAYRFYRHFPRCQPYVARGSSWFVGGSVLTDSRLHPFIQMADLLAGAARHAIVQRKPHGAWYGKHLIDHALKLRRDVDVSAHALAQLKRRSRNDACGSGWRDARLAPRR
jgi:hypothetical protein